MNTTTRMRYHGCLIAVAILLGVAMHSLALANGAPSRADLACDSGGGSVPPADLCLQATDADTPWRYIGITAGEDCPTPANWSGTKLFAQSTGMIPPGLNRFCVYEATTAVPDIAQLLSAQCAAPGAPPNCLSKLDPDSASVAMMGSDIADLIWEPLREQFLDQIGYAGPLPATPENVRVAVIDTEPSGLDQDLDGPGTSQHGFTLLNLMRDMVCPVSGTCAVQLKSRLGLPLRRCGSVTGFCRDESNGGYVGTIGDLAAAIRAAVRDWETGSVSNLVINLSVAWEPMFTGAQPIANSRVAAQAVYRALQDASCRGALVIAAAGNRQTGPDAFSGPLYPAGWETEDAPGFTACETLLDTAPTADFTAVYRPLVYASGAVYADNTPAETRPQGEPRLAAFGDHAVAPVDETTTATPTQILTGSSVAAAVVSSAAAAAWHYQNTLSAHEIMSTLYASAVGLGRPADFCNGPQPCPLPVKRVTVCRAIEQACAGLPAGSCPVLDCSAPGTILPALPEDDIELSFAGAPDLPLSDLDVQTSWDNCRTGFVLHSQSGTVVDDPCPHLQYFGVQVTPWTDGQPEGQFCPGCTDTFHSPGRLFLEIDSSLEGVLSDITLLCADDGYRVGGTLVAGDKLVISEIPEACESEDVAVAFRLDNGTGSPSSVASPALLIPDRDDDGVQDGLDNCVDVANADQFDGDGDGFGNMCDADFTDDCITNFLDIPYLRDAFLSSDPVADLNHNGVVNFQDVVIMKNLFFLPPGPSGIDNICE